MSNAIVQTGGSSTQVIVRGGNTQRVTLDQRTVAAISNQRPSSFARPSITPVDVVDRATSIHGAGAMGVQGPQGPPGDASGIKGDKGDPGVPGKDGQIRFTGFGAPGTVIGASPGDTYLDKNTGDIYTLS